MQIRCGGDGVECDFHTCKGEFSTSVFTVYSLYTCMAVHNLTSVILATSVLLCMKTWGTGDQLYEMLYLVSSSCPDLYVDLWRKSLVKDLLRS